MPKFLSYLIMFCLVSTVWAKEVSVEAIARAADISESMTADEALLLNAYRQVVTKELLDLKLESEVFWEKLDKKKMVAKDEYLFLKSFFSEEVIKRPETPPGAAAPLNGHITAQMDLEKLKLSYENIIYDVDELKLKTLYILPSIELDKGMSWEDVGVSRADSFNGVILSSWKKLFETQTKGFDRIVILDKDLPRKEFINPKSMTLKWTSLLKKISANSETQTAHYTLSAQYLLQKTREETTLSSFDFPEQKRLLETQNKKDLSSKLASLIYNLLLAETAKINSHIESDATALDFIEIEIKLAGRPGLLEINQLNSLLQEKLSAIKLNSRMKSVGADGSTIAVKAIGPAEKIWEAISIFATPVALNEQKILLFNRADKTFAILPKESNN